MAGAAVAPTVAAEAVDVKNSIAITDRTSLQSRMRIAELKARLTGADTKLADSIRVEISAIEHHEEAREHMEVLAWMRRMVKMCSKTVFLVDPLRLGLKLDAAKGQFVAINPESERVARGFNDEFKVLSATASVIQTYLARRRKGDSGGNIDVCCDEVDINWPVTLKGWQRDATTACDIPDDQADADDFGEVDFETDDEDEHYQAASQQFPVAQHFLFVVPW